MVQGKGFRLPGDRGDPMSRGQCLPGEQATGGAIGAEDGDTHDDRPDMSDDACRDPATEAFVAHRNMLFTVAYEMLADAENVLQETWLQWAAIDLGTVRDPRALLVRITTRQAIRRLHTLGECYDRPGPLDLSIRPPLGPYRRQ